jgi:hypothetical protein
VKKKSSPAKKATRRWSLGVFTSAYTDGARVVLYCRKDGTIMPSLKAKVKNKKALAHDVFVGITYAQARAKLLKAAKAARAERFVGKPGDVTITPPARRAT